MGVAGTVVMYGLDGSAGNDRSRLIGDLPGDRAAIHLRICRLGQGEEGGDRKDAGAHRTSTEHNRSFAFPAEAGVPRLPPCFPRRL